MTSPLRCLAMFSWLLLMGCSATTPVLQQVSPLSSGEVQADTAAMVDTDAITDEISAEAGLSTEPLEPPPPPLPAVTAFDASDISMEQVSMLPGQFIWEPEKASRGRLEIRIVMPRQTAYVYRGGTLIGMAGISTGKPGHETPAGTYDILEKRRDHVSNLYPDGDMPFMQRLTWDGIALHGGRNPGYPASHGCVRFPNEFAEILFETTRIGTRVVVLDKDPTGMVASFTPRENKTGNAVVQEILAEQ